MSECRICGRELREGEDAIDAGGDRVHVDCVYAPVTAKRQKRSVFEGWGVLNQMALGEDQREP